MYTAYGTSEYLKESSFTIDLTRRLDPPSPGRRLMYFVGNLIVAFGATGYALISKGWWMAGWVIVILSIGPSIIVSILFLKSHGGWSFVKKNLSLMFSEEGGS